MKKTLFVSFVLLFMLLTLSSCISTKKVIETRLVENIVQMNPSLKYKIIASMQKNYKVKFTFFSRTQKPTDEDITQRIQQETINKYGNNAIASDIVFSVIAKSTDDLFATLTGSTSLVEGTKYKIEANWNVYIPAN